MKPFYLFLLACVLGSWPLFSLRGQSPSPWLPYRGELTLNPSYVFETYDEYWFGESKRDIPFGDVDQHTFLAAFEYGILESLAVDAAFGYTRVLSSGMDANDGWADSTFGIRYCALDERQEDFPDYLPTVTVRLGGIVEGSYDTRFLGAAGKGTSGFEVSILAGKELEEIDLRFYGDVGYRFLAQDVPDDLFLGVGVSKTLLGNILVSAGYRHVQSLSGPDVDLDDPDFRASEFPERKEFREIVELGLALRDEGDREYGLQLAHTFEGRNTGRRLTLGFYVFLPF